jgi:SAM-dependent methyltransferase
MRARIRFGPGVCAGGAGRETMADDSYQSTAGANARWFADNDRYIESQSRLEHYRHIHRMVVHELRGVGRLLDVGNGGFFNYDPGLAEHVTAVDLFLAEGPGPFPNTAFRRGSLLDLPCPDQSFGCVLMQNVFHHVTGRSVAENHRNLQRGMREIHRCLEPGGKAIVIESTVGRLFYGFERLVYRPALAVKTGGHPVTFQFTAPQLIAAAGDCGFELEEWSYVPRGRYVLQFGYTWPTLLTPARTVKLLLRR